MISAQKTRLKLQGQAQDKTTILHQKGIHTAVAFHNGTDALHANAMSRFVGHRNSIFKGNLTAAGIFYLQKKMVIFIIKLYINDACFLCSRKRLTGVQCVFQCI